MKKKRKGKKRKIRPAWSEIFRAQTCMHTYIGTYPDTDTQSCLMLWLHHSKNNHTEQGVGGGFRFYGACFKSQPYCILDKYKLYHIFLYLQRVVAEHKYPAQRNTWNIKPWSWPVQPQSYTVGSSVPCSRALQQCWGEWGPTNHFTYQIFPGRGCYG